MENKVLIKYVRKSSKWCRTSWIKSAKGLKQKQEWFDTKEAAENYKEE